MYVHSILLTCLRGLIGFRRSYNSQIPDVDADLQQSSSGIYVDNGMHPLFTYDNIVAIAEQFSKVSVTSWVGTVTYQQGDIVEENDKIYQSKSNGNIGKSPSTNPGDWAETTLLSAYLRRLYDGAVLKLAATLFTAKKVNEVAKSLHANISLYEGVGSIDKRIVKKGRLVGLKLTLKNQDTTAVLNYIGLQVDTAQNPVPIYLYHSSHAAPLKVFELDQTKSVTIQWHKIAQEVLAFMNDDVDTAGHYYLCYYEADLTGSAIRKDVSFTGKTLCGNCSENVANRQLYGKWGQFIAIQPFYVNPDDLHDDKSMWDAEKEMLVDDTTWGLNMKLSIQCDVTNWLCQNKNVLVDALKKQLTVDILQEMTFSLRDNQRKERLAGLAAAALDNQENGQYGEMKNLAMVIKAVSFDFSNLSPMCLPCNQASTMFKQKSVWRG